MTPQPASAPLPHEERSPSGLYLALRIFGLVVLALMLVSIMYAGWISFVNWGSIQV